MLMRLIGLVAAALMLVGAARADVTVGVNDDAGQDAAQAGWFYATAGAEGLQVDAITLRWDDGSPSTVPEQAEVERALALAEANGVTIELNLFPLHSQVFTGAAGCASSTDPESCGDTTRIQQFAAWTGEVARTFPTVHEFVVMNECNTSLFVNPQYVRGKNVSAARCGIFLAATYDALKEVDPTIFVWGLGLSPRGNPVPTDKSSPRATNPIDWLGFLGAWYRSSGRSRPLMDGLDLHPYPIPQSLPFETGYPGRTSFSVTNLPRAYQAFYDAFKGTGQATVGPGRLPVSLNEVGIQTTPAPAVAAAYTGWENAEGVEVTGSEAYQAAWYRKLVDFSLCDADVTKVNIFKLVDETALQGWQSGLFFSGYVPKSSAAAFTDELALTAGLCPTGDASYFVPGGSSPPADDRIAKGLVRKVVVAARAATSRP
jgi:hypothetical protein